MNTINTKEKLAIAVKDTEMSAIITGIPADARKEYLQEIVRNNPPTIDSHKRSFVCLTSFWLKDIDVKLAPDDVDRMSIIRREYLSLSVVFGLLETTKFFNQERINEFDEMFSGLFKYAKDAKSFADLISYLNKARLDLEDKYTNYRTLGLDAAIAAGWCPVYCETFIRPFLKDYQKAAKMKYLPSFIFDIKGEVEGSLCKKINELIVNESIGAIKVFSDKEWPYVGVGNGAFLDEMMDYMSYDASEVFTKK